MTDKLAIEINQMLLESPLIKEFKKYEQLVQTFSKQEEELKKLQQLMLKQKLSHDSSYEVTKQLYDKQSEAFYSHPYLQNYKQLKEEVNNYLLEVEDYINRGLEVK